MGSLQMVGIEGKPFKSKKIYPKTIGNFNSLDVRSGKVIAFEKKLFAGVFRQRVEAAIADIQTGGMTPFSILAPYTSCNFVLLGIHRNDLYPGTMK